MSDPKNVAAKYEAEVKQADLDHHKPTAGAMTGHILANFWVFDMKLHKAKWYLTGALSVAAQPLFAEMIEKNRANIDELGELLLDENEVVPTTTKEVHAYGKLTEDGSYKYLDSEELVGQTAADFVTQDMFIDRAIKLAERENRPALAQYLVDLRRYNNGMQRKLQAILGKTAWEGLVEVDEDDED